MRNGSSSRQWIAAVSALLALTVACGKSDSDRATIRGEVTLDGLPMEQGSILFIPVDGNPGVTAGGTVAQGKFELLGDTGPHAGWNRVEIRSVRKSGRMVPKPLAPAGEMVESDEEAVADQFNAASTIKLNLLPGDNRQTFAVTSRPRR